MPKNERGSMRNDGRSVALAVVERVESRLLFSASPFEVSSPDVAAEIIDPVPPLMTVVASTAGYVRGGAHANRNFGTSSTLVVKASRHSNHAREAYVTFDL